MKISERDDIIGTVYMVLAVIIMELIAAFLIGEKP